MKEKTSINEVSILGVDLAKQVFQLHGARCDGSVVFWKKLSRNQVITFLAMMPPCIVATEACATAHFWAREIGALSHEVRLVPPAYMMEAGGPGWLDDEVASAELPDKRLARRLRRLLDQMSGAPGQPVPAACGDWAATKAAYRFFGNPRVTELGVLAGLFAATAVRCAASGGVQPRTCRVRALEDG